MTEMPPLPKPIDGRKLYTAEEVREWMRAAVKAEREACAKVCDDVAKGIGPKSEGRRVTPVQIEVVIATAEELATAIRARGES